MYCKIVYFGSAIFRTMLLLHFMLCGILLSIVQFYAPKTQVVILIITLNACLALIGIN